MPSNNAQPSRSDCVLPLTGKIETRIDSLAAGVRAASFTAACNRLTKEQERLKKQHHRLLAYDEKLRQDADLRVRLNLDDGVKVNYGKFGVCWPR